MMEAARTSEASVDNYFTRQYIPEDNSELHTRHRENLKSHKPIHVCAKTAFFGWPSAESMQISSVHNFLSFNLYFRKYFKVVCRENVVMVTLDTGTVSFDYLHALLGVGNFLKVACVCTDHL
jgi:hypothetical protein